MRRVLPVLALFVFPLVLVAGGKFDNPLKPALLDPEKSAEEPAMFSARERQVRWHNIFQDGQPCWVGETWRTKPEEDRNVPHRLLLRFRQPFKIGTLIAFGGDRNPNPFRVEGSREAPGSVAVVPFGRLVTEVVFTGVDLPMRTLVNWGSRKQLERPIESYQLEIAGIYALPEIRVNLAPAATPRVSGFSSRNAAFAARNRAAGLNDMDSNIHWRSQKLKAGETAEAALEFPQPVKLRELALYVGGEEYGDRPRLARVFATDGNGKENAFGTIDVFPEHDRTGDRFFLLSNPAPEKPLKSIRLELTPRGDCVAVGEILALAAPGDNPKLTPGGPREFTLAFPVEQSGAVFASGQILDEKGNFVRHLAPVAGKGAFSLTWDGLDDEGKIVPPGNYTLHGATRGALRAEYESTPYNAGNPPWVTPSRRGGWLSDHAAPCAVEVLDDRIWVGAPYAECADTIMELDGDGRKLWGVRWLNLGGASFLRAYGGRMYVASGGAWLGSKTVISEVDPATHEFRTLLQRDYPVTLEKKERFHRRILTGFAAGENRLLLAYGEFNKVEVFDFSGKLLRTLEVQQPGAMRIDPNGTTYIFSGSRLCTIDLETGKTTPVIAAGLIEPRDFSVFSDGFLVADYGANQVKLFDRAGKFIRSCGSGEPRSVGNFRKEILHAPSSAALLKGEIWVAESSLRPKRISVWDGASGAFKRDYLGPGRYESGGWLDLADSNVYFAEGMIFRRKDIKAPWELESVYLDEKNPTVQLLLDNRLGPERPLRRDGRLYLARDRHWDIPAYWYGEIRADKILYPCAALGSGKLVRRMFADFPEKSTFLWMDDNGDGRMDRAEVRELPGEFTGLLWSARMGDDLSFNWVRNRNELCRLKVPYDPAKIEVLTALAGRSAPVAIAPLSDHSMLVNRAPFLEAFEEGKVRWRYPNLFPGNSHASPLPQEGEIQHTLNVEGVVALPGFGSVFLLNSNKGLRHLFSTDGVYLGRLFGDQRQTPPLAIETVKPGDDLSGYSLMGEAFCGTFERGADGIVRFSGGKGHHTISQIKGLETLRRFERPFRFTPEQRNLAEQAVLLRAQRLHQSELRESLQLNVNAAPKQLRAYAPDWAELPGGVFRERDKTLFEVKMALDKEYFYAFWAVPQDDSAFVNGGDDWKLLFKTGDSVNLELGSARGKEPNPGDFRLLIAPFNGDPIAVLYTWRSRVPGEKTVFSSPVGEVEADSVKKLDNALIRVRRTGGGYFVECRIPRAELPVLESRPLYGDAGVIFSDPAGRINQRNVFYHNAARGITDDIPAEIRAQPGNWREIQVKEQK